MHTGGAELLLFDIGKQKVRSHGRKTKSLLEIGNLRLIGLNPPTEFSPPS